MKTFEWIEDLEYPVEVLAEQEFLISELEAKAKAEAEVEAKVEAKVKTKRNR